MAISWTLLVVVYAINSLFLASMYLAQSFDTHLPPRGSLIPGTNLPFLYAQDWHNLLWGDAIGLPLVTYACVHLATKGLVSNWQWFLGLVIAASTPIILHGVIQMAPNHRIDYGTYAAGKQSVAGYMHLPYFGVQLAATTVAFIGMVNGKLRGPALWLALAGGAIYIASCVTDALVGNYNQPKNT